MAPRQGPQARPPTGPRLLSALSHASKASFRSHSSSFEADDERSDRSTGFDSDDDSDSTMSPPRILNGGGDSGGHQHHGHHHGHHHENGNGAATSSPPSRYPGEDTRPTSRKELAGWYAYAFAAEVYVICGIGSFIPILLESLARENGVLQSDRTTPCGPSSDKGDEGDACIITVLGLDINTASFTMYTFSVSVLLQALLVITISCAADHGNYRKRLLLGFGWVGSFAVILYLFVNSSTYLLGAFLAIVSNTSFGASFVLLNSFLPLVVRHHPALQAPEIDSRTPDLGADNEESQRLEDSGYLEGPEPDINDSTAALLSPSTPVQRDLMNEHMRKQREQTSKELTLSTQISAKGIGIGYSAGLVLQCLAILILVKMGNSTWSLRIVLFMIGVWWATFTIPAAMWLRPRPGPPLPSAMSRTGIGAWVAYAAYAWKSLFRTIQLARRLLDIVLFLGAWFLLSDAIATTSSTAILFAKTSLHMKPWALALINVISTTFGVIGAFSWSWISRKFKLRPHQTILVCIALFETIPLYGLLGYLPFVRAWGVLGLQQPWEMYPLAAIYGFVLGGLSGYCRSLYGELIPPGSEAAFYALYAITDKGSSVFGPAIVGAIIGASGEIRPAFWFLAALVGFPAPLLWFVNAERGKREGEKLAELIEGFKPGFSDESGSGSATGSDIDAESQAILAAYSGRQDDG